MAFIRVWVYSDNKWVRIKTLDIVGTIAEEKYFRVRMGGVKHFYYTRDDYIAHLFK